MKEILSLLFITGVAIAASQNTMADSKELPSLYEYYTSGGISSGLVATADGFLLNGKPFKVISGSLHYFRVHPAYWRDRFRKMRAAGLTAIEMYVPWNLHEPQRDVFDFGQGNSDWSPLLNLVSFIKMAQEEDLFVLFRPGPYICSEWDFGGLPSWLLRDYTMHVRSSYTPYLNRVDNYFNQLIPLVTDLQFTQGGPIIAVQVENEYGAFGYSDQPRDRLYLEHLRDLMRSLGITEMFFTSDSPLATLDWGSVSGALQTANFQSNAPGELGKLAELQPNLPLMVTEFWTGWFDHWFEDHHGLSLSQFNTTLKEIFSLNSSVNFYMFHGGTNFGFMNGANSLSEYPDYLPDVTSYDYDCQLSEAGDYTPKYYATKEIVEANLPVQTRLPEAPAQTEKVAYPSIQVAEYLSLNDLIEQVPAEKKVRSSTVISMEELPINNNNGQSYGFAVYRSVQNLETNSQLKIRGHVRDLLQVLVNGELQTPPVTSMLQLRNFGSWYPRDASFTFNLDAASADAVLDLMVENLGRVNYGKPHDFLQKKGLWEGPVIVDGNQINDWEIIALEFEGPWVRGLQNWRPASGSTLNGPVAVRATLEVSGTPSDTFINMSGWGKGVVFVNGFNIGRYWSVGPQRNLYIPGPLLQTGPNTITIFELYSTGAEVSFSSQPDLGKLNADITLNFA